MVISPLGMETARLYRFNVYKTLKRRRVSTGFEHLMDVQFMSCVQGGVVEAATGGVL